MKSANADYILDHQLEFYFVDALDQIKRLKPASPSAYLSDYFKCISAKDASTQVILRDYAFVSKTKKNRLAFSEKLISIFWVDEYLTASEAHQYVELRMISNYNVIIHNL